MRFMFLYALTIIATVTAADLPTHDSVRTALKTIVAESNGGFGLNMWASVVDRDGQVVVLCHSGDHRGDQWPGSRVISAQKASTANGFSLPKLALSTANLYTATQPGSFAYGLQHSNPVDTAAAYGGKSSDMGTNKDPMIGKKIGGINIFGGGLALYGSDGVIIGGLGVSGDSSVADHVIAWKLRTALKLNYVPSGISPTGDDNMVLDIVNGVSASGWGHPITTPAAKIIVDALPTSHPIAKVAGK